MLSTLYNKVTPKQKSDKLKNLVVPLEPTPQRLIKKEDKIVMKLRSTPTDPNSQEYQITTSAFDEGSPEQWLCYLDVIGKIFTGQTLQKAQNASLCVAAYLRAKRYRILTQLS